MHISAQCVQCTRKDNQKLCRDDAGTHYQITFCELISHQLKRRMDKLSKSTYPSLAPITFFVISGLQSVTH